MSDAFRELLKKIGSGPHTGQSLNREEAASAMRMMLLGEATPAQIGAFSIAHRIKRPTGEELAGMLDAYDELGPHLGEIAGIEAIVLGVPYDGRSRTAPVTLLTALILANAGESVVMHGGDRMPTKYGVPLIDLWQGVGIDWRSLDLAQTQAVFEKTGIGFVYLPAHFPEAASLIPYREQIGKRPPIATLELIWCPYAGKAHIVSGFVHPPTENMFREAFRLRGQAHFTTVKGLEGSCDLPRDRAAIVGVKHPERSPHDELERLLLHARDYGFSSVNVPLCSEAFLIEQMQDILKGEESDLLPSVLWNAGFYLWHRGIASNLEIGTQIAKEALSEGQILAKVGAIAEAVAAS